MFKEDINSLITSIKKEMSPYFDKVYFRHSYELNGIDDSIPYQAYISFTNDKESILIDQKSQNTPSNFQIRMKAVFQFTQSVDFDSVLDQAIFCISNHKFNGSSCKVESVLADSGQIVLNETNVKLKKQMPLILINFVLRKNRLLASCGQICENDCK